MNLVTAIENFKPWNEQEEYDKLLMLAELKNNPQAFDRESLTVHFTASAWVVNQNKDKILMIYHNIYDSWSWLGGHADGDQDLLHVAVKEVKEESGLTEVTPLMEDIFSLEVLTVDGHIKHGKYVSSHLHMNVTYLIEADEAAPLSIKPDENSGISWYTFEEGLERSTQYWFKEWIYPKLNAKLELFKQNKLN